MLYPFLQSLSDSCKTDMNDGEHELEWIVSRINTSGVSINDEVFMGIWGDEVQSKFYAKEFGRVNRKECR